MSPPSFSPRISAGNIITILMLIAGAITTYVQLQEQVKAQAATVSGLTPRVKALEEGERAIAERLARIEQSSVDANGSLKRIESILTKGK